MHKYCTNLDIVSFHPLKVKNFHSEWKKKNHNSNNKCVKKRGREKEMTNILYTSVFENINMKKNLGSDVSVFQFPHKQEVSSCQKSFITCPSNY